VVEVFFDSLGDAVSGLGLNRIVTFAAIALAALAWILYRRNRAFLLESGEQGIKDEIGLANLTPVTRSRFRTWLSALAETLDRHFGSRAYSARSYLWCLKFAVAYATVGAYLSWALSNHDAFGVGELVPGLGAERRAGAVIVSVLLALFTIHFRTATGVQRALTFLAVIALPPAAWAIGIPPSLVIVSAVPAFAFAFLVIGGRATLPLFISGAVFSILVHLLDPQPTAQSLIRAFAVIGLLYGAVASIVLMIRTALNRRGLLAIANLFAWFALAFVTLAVVGFLPDEPDYPLVRYLLCFLIVIPLVNSVFDWLALETARLAVRRSAATGHIYRFLSYDLAAGGLLLLLSVGAVAAALGGLNAVASLRSNPALIDIASLAREVRVDPFSASIGWVYLVLFSTLLPSLLHLVATSTSLLTANLPRRWYDWHRDGLRTGVVGRPRKLFYHSCFMTMVSLSSAFVVAFWLALFVGATVLIVSAVPTLLESILALMLRVIEAVG
jgi:hypothetical protein